MLKWKFALTGLCLFGLATTLWAADQPKDIDEKATHVDTDKIKVPGVNAFSVDPEGRIVAACGTGPGEIKVLNPDGSEVRSWTVDVKPEAVHATADGNVLVAGVGKVMRFSIEGKLLHAADSPHAEALRSGSEKLREAAIARLTRGPTDYSSMVTAYTQMVEQLEAKKKAGKITEQEERILTSLPNTLKILEQRVAEQEKQAKDKKQPTEEEIQKVVDSMIRGKLRVSSVSSDGDHVYVATKAAVGYGFDVWKMKPDFTSGEQIVTGLRGCCGQMDVQCCTTGLYVAENSRHRVVCFDKTGEELLTWGKRDRTGIDGFTSCCNPMNVCFGANGDVYTAESNTGRIKRFSKDGKFLAFVGDVKLVPGCKNVSIAVSPDGEQVYMLDITRGHIVVMTKREEAAVAENAGG